MSIQQRAKDLQLCNLSAKEAMAQAVSEAESEQNYAPCPACPDGNEWHSNGPSGRACKVCGGCAVVSLDGSQLTKEQRSAL